jgi:DNA-binding transcriptional regulator LsrR (DeoR family)
MDSNEGVAARIRIKEAWVRRVLLKAMHKYIVQIKYRNELSFNLLKNLLKKVEVRRKVSAVV